jgi:hypothetical protein
MFVIAKRLASYDYLGRCIQMCGVLECAIYLLRDQHIILFHLPIHAGMTTSVPSNGIQKLAQIAAELKNVVPTPQFAMPGKSVKVVRGRKDGIRNRKQSLAKKVAPATDKPATPKKRGRPKKVEVEGDDAIEPKKRGRPKKVEVSTDEPIEPKKRGRPKKVEVSTDEPIEPKKRGRPKKVEVAGDDAIEPKKRGRPKKVVVETDEPNGAAEAAAPKRVASADTAAVKRVRSSDVTHKAKRIKNTDTDTTPPEKELTLRELKKNLIPGEGLTVEQLERILESIVARAPDNYTLLPSILSSVAPAMLDPTLAPNIAKYLVSSSKGRGPVGKYLREVDRFFWREHIPAFIRLTRDSDKPLWEHGDLFIGYALCSGNKPAEAWRSLVNATFSNIKINVQPNNKSVSAFFNFVGMASSSSKLKNKV